MESGGAVYQLSQRKLQEVVASLGKMLAELLWLPVVATHQLHCRALRGWELPSRSKKDQRVEWMMGSNLRWRIRRRGLQQRRPSRSTTRSIWGGVPQGRCGKLRCAKRWNCPRCSNFVLRGRRILLDRTSYHVAGSSCSFGGQCPAAVC